MTTNFLEQLNPAQRESVESIEGPVLIVAGPGSGKTRVITNRIAHLVLDQKVSPYNIGAVTFTNKASREMKDRLVPLLGNDAKTLTVGTFHSFCSMILRRSGDYLGLSNNFVIYDDDDQISAIKQSMKDVDVDPKQFNPRSVLSTISNSKSQLVNSEGFNTQKSNYYEEVVSKIFERYEDILNQGSALDFDDLLLKTHLLLTEFRDAAKIYQNRFHYFMVDEFQDTNIAQYSIAKIITETSRNLCVVGDPDQSIYSWRNADIRNILSFQSDFPEAKILPLEQNYRSSQNILDAAKNIISKNQQRVDKNLWTTNDKGSLISIDEAYDEEEEARKVVKEIQGLVDNDDHSLSDFAVMYRVNAQSRSFEMACQRFGVPYQIVGGIKFYHRREIKDITSYLRLILNSEDDISLSRIVNVPPRGIGQRTLSEVNRIARQSNRSLYESIVSITSSDNTSHQLGNRAINSLKQFISCIDQLKKSATDSDIMQLIDLVVSETGYRKYIEADENAEERLENIQEYRNSSREYSSVPALEGLVVFLEGISLISDIDTFEEDIDSITLITLHQSKGLEFPIVFITGMEEGLLPHIRSLDSGSPEELEEERRLCYVGLTRAEKKLYLTRAFRRGFRGTYEPTVPSRFLSDIPPALIISKASPAEPETLATKSENKILRFPKNPQRKNHSKPVASTSNKNRTTHRATPTKRTVTKINISAPGKSINFQIGDKVKHSKFGDGIVMSSDPAGDDLQITVAFKDGGGIKKLLQSLAKLKKI
tara:strand:- start:1780 stop:4074 length:2295 start_codon:yes stop_codon:yes gene_type:complete